MLHGLGWRFGGPGANNCLKTGTTQSYGQRPEGTSTIGFEEWLPGPGSYAQILKHIHKTQPLGY